MAVAEPGGLPTLIGDQARASVPTDHIWLAASAGTGKTQVLAARVFRLLLRGTEPGAILCITFTKAGAAEMAGRIAERLAAWVRMPEEALGRDLAALGERPTPELRARARTLFAKLLDAPGGGIRISTIHGFCQSLLVAFPVEAGLVPGFRPIEGRDEQALARVVLADVLNAAERDGRAWLIDAVAALSLRLGEGGAEEFLRECARESAAMAQLPAGIQAAVRRALGLTTETIGDPSIDACRDEAFDVAAVRRLAAANRAAGGVITARHAEIAEHWIAASPSDRSAMLKGLASLGFTAEGGPRRISAKLVKADPDYEALVMKVASACRDLLDHKAQLDYADLLAQGLAAGRAYADAYVLAKRRLGVADFDDLIRATLALLQQPGMGAWVRYKLDLTTEHVLVDEAQDTNLRQWKIVDAIIDEFFAGAGTRSDARTLFVVGDYKQAIFGFQGTDPAYFRWAEGYFEGRARAARDEAEDEGTPFHRLALTHSFRSTQAVLDFVDASIAQLPDPGLGLFADTMPHASKVSGPGQVVLWPPVVAGSSDDPDDAVADDADQLLAERIAAQIRAWLDPGDPMMLASKGRSLHPQDVMVLVQRRGKLAARIVARLHAHGVPVAGVDRLRLNAPLAVQDLLAALRFALQPDDDLSLASVLVSPLMGWSQDELLAAAVPRSTSLWRHLRAHQSDERLVLLYDLLARADLATPYQLLEHLLSGPFDGRRKLIGRLGAEARDPIDELLNAALDFEASATPALQRFLDWFDRGNVDVKRDSSKPLDSVRVMTAHGAKGLQAPLVILADACVDPASAPRSMLRWSMDETRDPVPIFRPRAAEQGPVLTALLNDVRQRELAEHWRLFYVAATRAEEVLVIAGALGPRSRGEPPINSWYSAADRTFSALGLTGAGEVRVFRGHMPQPPVPERPRSPTRPALDTPLPAWARMAAPVEARPSRPLAPSTLGTDAVADPPATPALRAAAARGRLVHALLERLPAVAVSDRARAADHWLLNAAGLADAAQRAALVRDVARVLDDPAFADLFGPDALAEAPIAATIDGGLTVSGTVDRLLILPDRVRVVDFKTGRRAPATVDAIPAYHLRQMAAYAAALAAIFPGRVVEASLLYTAAPVLLTIPPALLARHKPGFEGGEQSLSPPA